MALVFEGTTTCSICSKRLERGDRIFATSGVFLPDSNTLQGFCDTAMHWECYMNWDKRKEFAFEYSKVIIEDEKNNVFWAKVYLDNNFFIKVSLESSIGIVRIIPLYTGEFIDVKLAEWSSWLDEKQKNSNIPEFEKETFDVLIPILVKIFPTEESILEMVDWENKQVLVEKFTFERKQAEEKKIEEIRIYNQRLNEFNNSRLKCPKCENKNVRFLDRSPERKSYFICKACGRSFRLEDIESMK